MATAADVTVAEDPKKLFAELAKDFGKLDIVFANAGISGRTPTGTTDEAIFEKRSPHQPQRCFLYHAINSAALSLMNDNGSIIFFNGIGARLISVNQAWLPTLPRKADPSRWRDPSPPTLHRARSAVERGGPGSDEDSHLEARARANATAEESAKVSDFLLFHGSTCPLGRAGKDVAKAVLFLASDDLVVHQRGRADGGWRT